MGPKGSIKPVRANVEYWECIATFLADGSGDLTLEYGSGMAVAHDDVGEYTITFTEYGPGPLLDCEIKVQTIATEEPPQAKPDADGYDSGTQTFEVWDIDETAAKVDVAEDARVVITAKFLKTV